jgi:hypothetical protein
MVGAVEQVLGLVRLAMTGDIKDVFADKSSRI